jgi:excisionase family DNA binding protein
MTVERPDRGGHVPEDRAHPIHPLPDRLPLGKASRLLGVDPDTLRRWADEGRVPAFTTPGGHRRFERRALERLVAARRTGPATGLAGFGDTPNRLTAAYRRRYGELHGMGPDARARVPQSERATFRENGRRLVDALVRHLDSAGVERARAEQEALSLTAHMGDRLACLGVPLRDGVSMFVAARRPFLAELSVMARRRGVDGARVGQLYDSSTGLLDRLLIAFIGAHQAAESVVDDPPVSGSPSRAGSREPGATGRPGPDGR